MWRIKNMLTSTFMIGFSILMTYALAIGACMAILQSEFLKSVPGVQMVFIILQKVPMHTFL